MVQASDRNVGNKLLSATETDANIQKPDNLI